MGKIKTGIARFAQDTAEMSETAIILGQLYRYGSEWKFKAVGQGFNGAGGIGPAFRGWIGRECCPATTHNSPTVRFAPGAGRNSPGTPCLCPTATYDSPGSGRNSPGNLCPCSRPIKTAALSVTDDQLRAQCQNLERAGSGFLNWLEENPERSVRKTGLTKDFRRLAAQARRLIRPRNGRCAPGCLAPASPASPI